MLALPNRVVVMCSESVWRRCHRRLIVDAALVRDGDLLLHPGGEALF